jgi:hypothetical protein
VKNSGQNAKQHSNIRCFKTDEGESSAQIAKHGRHHSTTGVRESGVVAIYVPMFGRIAELKFVALGLQNKRKIGYP